MRRRQPVKKENSVQTIFSRFMLIVAFFVIWIGIIGVRLVHLQVNQYSSYREKALSQRRLESKSKMLRGTLEELKTYSDFGCRPDFAARDGKLTIDPR